MIKDKYKVRNPVPGELIYWRPNREDANDLANEQQHKGRKTRIVSAYKGYDIHVYFEY